MDRACLEYGVRAGLIFCLAREFTLELNEIIVKKAVKYRARGVVGIDLAGPEVHTLEDRRRGGGLPRTSFARARAASLGTTVHTGETTYTAAAGVLAVLEKIGADPHRPRDRRGRQPRGGAQAGRGRMRPRDLPEPNLRTRAVSSLAELGRALRTFDEAGVRFTINTDGPYLLNTHLRGELEMLMDAQILTESQIERCIAVAQATFLR